MCFLIALGRFGAPKWMNNHDFWILLGPFWGQKSPKWHPKNHPKIDAEKIPKKISQSCPFLDHFWVKNLKKGIQKRIQKSMPKKCRKMMPKGSQNDAKMDAKIMICSICSRKGDFVKTRTTLERELAYEGSGVQKSMKK